MTIPEPLLPVEQGLLPCDFCGDPMRIDNSGTMRHVKPGDCIIGVYAWGATPKAVAAWNTRHRLAAQSSPGREKALRECEALATEEFGHCVRRHREANEAGDKERAGKQACAAASSAIIMHAIRALSANDTQPRDEREGEVSGRVADLQLALDLALARLGEMEPPDSRAVSSEFVAMAAISCDLDDLDSSREIIRNALSAIEGSTP